MRNMWIGTHCKKSMYLRYRIAGQMHCPPAVLQPGNEETIKTVESYCSNRAKKILRYSLPFLVLELKPHRLAQISHS